jgi:predicted transcriptional regulator
MEVHFTPDFEARLKQIAAEGGRDAGELVQEIVENHLNHDRWFRGEVHKGLNQLEGGDFIEHEEIVARVERMFRS